MIRVGIGGWVFAPWRGAFYPQGLPQARELAHASRALTTIEINGTFYGTQKPESFRRWAEETPDDFVFSLKGPRFATNRRVLAEAGPSIERFFDSGVLELKSKLGPVLWQLPPGKAFASDDFAAFLGAAAAEPRWPCDPACGRGAAPELLRAGIHSADAQVLGGDRARRFGQASADRRRDGRLSLCAPAAHRRGGLDRLRRRATSRPGRNARAPGKRAARRPISPRSRPRRREGRSATCSST